MVMPTVASAAAAALHPAISTRRVGVVGNGIASAAAAGGRLAGGGRGAVVRARVAEAAPVAAEGGRLEAPPAAPMVEIPVTCYQVNGWSRLVCFIDCNFENGAHLLLSDRRRLISAAPCQLITWVAD
jgi:hypothetical protein